MKPTLAVPLCCAAALLAGCTKGGTEKQPVESKQDKPPAYFLVDPATAGTIAGTIRFTGPKPRLKPIDMSSDPACVEAHHGKAYDESLVVGRNGAIAGAFVYIKTGLEGKQFETPATPLEMDQRGCTFSPRVLGIQAGQPLRIVNSDPVTHNIHPLAEVNREWNHSQGAGEPPIIRRFPRPEVMIPVKCNIHSWMHAFIGVVAHPYFAVTGGDGAFQIGNVPPGDYTLQVWHEKLGTQDRNITVTASGKVQADFTLKGE
ncbi:MAG TPA: carboxypeptidase regulatory-like domain-containing protein [Bryobacteraceae bacterium]|nr:carboxypeptidase regulatory-like domain-containing protein [Bryobacteraceae bacterium]